ncbi:MAG: pilus assembly protein [Deltaproteobacteria bacterium]|nr:pilus assembly protein [Deltaproteobacteria bacterium]
MSRKDRKPTKTLAADTGGAVYVEFILSFIPLLFMFLGIIQMAMLYAASIVVQHAAVTATRAAAVVLDDDPSRYDEQDRRTVTGSESGGAPEEGAMGGLFGGGGGGSIGGSGSSGSARFSAIRYAAMVPLMTVTPPPEAFFPMGRRASLATDIGFNAPETRAAMALWYSRGMMNITFPREVRGESFRADWPRPDENGNSEQVTARVTFLYMCGVPIVNRIMCEDGLSLMAGSGAPGLAESLAIYGRDGSIDMNEMQMLNDQRERSERHFDQWEDEMGEIDDGPGFGTALAIYGVTFATMGGGARFRPLQAEATLPVQAANYCYRSGGGGDCWTQN